MSDLTKDELAELRRGCEIYLASVDAGDPWGVDIVTSFNRLGGEHQVILRLIEMAMRSARAEGEVADLETELKEARTRCTVHNDSIHGAEAEELRRGLEDILKNEVDEGLAVGVTVGTIQDLLDRVDARDSLAFLERAERRAVARVAELDAEVARLKNKPCPHDGPEAGGRR